MIKNTAGQKIGAQMVSATDGSAFTSAVTVYVTLDAGTQAQGTVGSGACTHEGNGYHTYAPSQAETNGDLIGYTFIGTGAIPQTVQVYTITGDAFARLGAPAGASVSADIAAIQSDSAAILVDTGTTLPATLSTIAGYIDTEIGTIITDIAAVKADTAAILTDTGTTLDGKIDTIDTVVDAIKAKTDSLTFTVAGNADVNIQYVNDVQVTGDGQSGTEWGPA